MTVCGNYIIAFQERVDFTLDSESIKNIKSPESIKRLLEIWKTKMEEAWWQAPKTLHGQFDINKRNAGLIGGRFYLFDY